MFGAALFAALFSISNAASAQAVASNRTVRGVVRDSTKGGEALSDAVVRIVSQNVEVRTDKRGRFEFNKLAPGRYELIVQSAVLDSMGLEPLKGVADVTEKKRVDLVLAIPGRDTFANLMCGGPLASDMGILHGRLIAAPAENSSEIADSTQYEIGAHWLETHLSIGNMEQRERASSTAAYLGRTFILCDVPVDVDNILRVTGRTLNDTVQVFARIPGFMARRDIYIGSNTTASVAFTVRGKVGSVKGKPVENPSVADAVTGLIVSRPDEAGRFSAQRPLHSQQLMIRGVGYQPKIVDINPSSLSVELGEILLEPIAQQLNAVVVKGRPATLEELAFNQRRSLGFGSFLDEETLSKVALVSASYVASQTTGLRTAPAGLGRQQLMFEVEGKACRPRFFLDGMNLGRIDPFEEEELLRLAKRIEAYRYQYAPGRFYDFQRCGSVVIWTR